MNPAEKVADVLREHIWDENNGTCACRDDQPDFGFSTAVYAAHVATAVVAALGLTEEWQPREIWLGTWLNEILHVHFQDMAEWETTDRWIADPTTFDIFGAPFDSAMDFDGDSTAARIHRSWTADRKILKRLRYENLQLQKRLDAAAMEHG